MSYSSFIVFFYAIHFVSSIVKSFVFLFFLFFKSVFFSLISLFFIDPTLFLYNFNSCVLYQAHDNNSSVYYLTFAVFLFFFSSLSLLPILCSLTLVVLFLLYCLCCWISLILQSFCYSIAHCLILSNPFCLCLLSFNCACL